MKQDDFFELFYSNLRKELNDDEFCDSIKELIEKNKLNKTNYRKALAGDLK